MKAKVLVVDDSSLARRTARIMLEGMGYTVEEASDGAQALERFFISRPDLVVLEMVMTGLYGMEVLAKMREMDPNARIIVATADIQKSTHEQAIAAGARAVVNKPLNRASLEKVVTETISEV